MEAVSEIANERGSVPNNLGKVLPRSGSGGATIWVWNLGADGINDVKYRGSTRRILVAGDGEEVAKAREKDLVEGGGRQCASGGSNKKY